MATISERLDRIESELAIRQLPGRYAAASDSKDLSAWVSLFIPEVNCGRYGVGRAVLRDLIGKSLSGFYRSVHFVGSQHFDFTSPNDAHGLVYCRAEHEIGDRFVVLAVQYEDTYQRLDGEWFFSRRRERHWYSADILEHPQDADFYGWAWIGPSVLPSDWESWREFWEGKDTSSLTAHPVL